jgi:hypothetical protein
MVSIHEEGSAEPVYQRRRRSWRSTDESEQEEFEVVDVLERSQTVEDWLTPDDHGVDLVPVPWEQDEVCPQGALDDLAPDEQCFTEATGNEGGTFERTYRRAAIVVWPESRRLALAAQAGVGFALPLLETLPDEEARALVALVVETWPHDLTRRGSGGELRGSLLLALARLGDLRRAARFFDVVLLEDGYDGAENAGIAACWEGLDRREIVPRVVALVAKHMEERTTACADLLERLLRVPDADGLVLAAAAVDHLPRTSEAHRWRPGLTPEAVARIVGALAQVGDPALVERAAAHVLAHPSRYPIDEVVVPCAIALGSALFGARVLQERALAHLDARIALPVEAPTNWARAANLGCGCENCCDLSAFLVDPTKERWSIRIAKPGRGHLRRCAQYADVDFETIRTGSPLLLVATKNQRSYEVRRAQRVDDLEKRERLIGTSA